MSSTTQTDRTGAAPDGLRFGRVLRAQSPGEWAVQWLLKRNCSLAPRQVLGVYLALCTLSLGIAALFWAHGATLVMPFATLEVVGVGLALLIYAAHAADSESIRLQGDALTVEHACGRHTDRVVFRTDRVRVEPEHGDGSLIELSGQGHRIVVGRFVRPELRPELADELRRTLRRGRWDAAFGPAFGAA
jgi:uncharacterized membrane protein